MLKKISLSLLPFVAVILFSSEQLSDDGRAGYTGSPGESDCTNCHGSFAVNTGGGSITLQNGGMPTNEYVAGQTYNLSITVARSSNSLFGFGFEALNTLNDNAGTLNITDAAATQIKTRVVNSITRRNVVHQLNAGSASGSKTFNFSWTAPITGAGPVTFYFAGAACDGNGNDNNDYIYKSSLTVNELLCTLPSQPSTITGNTSVCAGSSQTYSVASDTGASSFTWTLPPGWTGTSSANSITVTAGSVSGNISVVKNNSCGNSIPRTLSVSTSNLSVSVNKVDALCFGDSTGSANVLVSGGDAPYTYLWSTNPVQSGATATNLVAGNYTFTVTDGNSCSINSSVIITQPAAELTSTSGGNQTSCEGTGVLLGGTPSATGGTTPYSYLWSPSTGLNANNVSNPIATPGTTTQYQLQITDANGCMAIDSNTIIILPAPEPIVTIVNDTLFTSGTGPFQWFKNGTLIPGATNYYYIPLLPGDYTASISYSNGCSRESDTFSFNPVNIVDLGNQVEIQIFPNPATTIIQIAMPQTAENANLKIFSMESKLVAERNLYSGNNLIDMSQLQGGFYTFLIRYDNTIRVFKISLKTCTF